MTYEELLAKLNEQSRMIYANQTELIGWFNALRTVIEMHKPELTSSGELGCPECVKLIRTDDRAMTYRYPCPTVQAIEKELR